MTDDTQGREALERVMLRGATKSADADTAAARAHLAQLEQRLAAAEALNDRSICAYCGTIGPRTPEFMVDHASDCEQHPIHTLATLRSQLASAESDTQRLRQLQALIPTMLEALPWGAYKGALLEDSDIKAALASRQTEGTE